MKAARLVIILPLAAVAVLSLSILLGPSGDPGGRILHQLQPAAQAVPAGSQVLYRYDYEPRLDSCDGRHGTFGWNDVVLQIHFESATPTAELVEHSDRTLRRLGWDLAYNSGMQTGWTKHLENGSVANAQLSNAVPDQGGAAQRWDLVVSAPPVGRRASGC
jgi:hypothetical protein